MKNIILLVSLLFAVSCQPTQETKQENWDGHLLASDGDLLTIKYNGEGEAVQFKMLEGLEKTLERNKAGIFEGQLSIPDLDDGIFSYDILLYQKDSTGKMTELAYEPNDGERLFRWIGKNRNINFSKAKELAGEVIDTIVNSQFLEAERGLTIYRPKDIASTTPILYLTDGKVAGAYAPYVDSLITEGRIIPVILAGIHASQDNRYEEYVNNGIENDFFEPHKDFFFKEVMPFIENGIEDWKGKRYMYGFSNGGAFCMYCGINHPDHFEEIIAFSTADYISEFIQPIEFKFDAYPDFYLGAGRYEDRIYQNNVRFVGKMKDNGLNVQFKKFVSGHDYYVWQIAFLEYLLEEFAN